MSSIKSAIPLIAVLLSLAVSGQAGSLNLVMVGDIMMATTYPDPRLPANQGKDIFKDVTAVLSDADVTMGNLEGVLLEGGTCTKQLVKGRSYAFRTPPDYCQRLVDAGFDFMNFANNHINDFGAEGIKSTIETLEEYGLAYGGPYARVGSLEVKGRSIAVVSFAFSPNCNSVLEIAKAQRLVAAQARDHDITIVSMHAGGEGAKYLHTVNENEYFLGGPRGNVVAFAHAVIDSGADLVWGHGPHVPRALELYQDRLIAYSLGNFFTWGFNLDDERGYAPILRATVDSTGVFLGGQIISTLQRSLQYPTLDTLHRAAKLMKRLANEDFPMTAPDMTDDGILRRPGR